MSAERLLPGDLEHWHRMERGDRIVARGRDLARLEDRALRVLEDFWRAGPAQASTSWGKDSTVLAHLVARLGVGPVVWYPAGEIENPDCALVRDAFLAAHPVEYLEVPAELTSEDWDRLEGHDGAQAEFERLSRSVRRRYASGVRAEESGRRARAVAVHGEASRHTCRPLARWTSVHIFAYLAKHDLPVHPAYACTLGGTLDRGRIRVGTAGGVGGAGVGRRGWERTYYPEVYDRLGLADR